MLLVAGLARNGLRPVAKHWWQRTRGAGLATATVQRDSRYSKLSDEDMDYFRKVLGDKDVFTDPDALEPYNRDWMGKYQGHSKLALRPHTTAQVSAVLAHCNSRKLAVVPQGGNTGLVGGSVPVFDEVVLSLSGMNSIISFDEVSGVLVCQAGCILQALDEHLAQHGFAMPLDLGAKGSCHIGGNVSTNAGGLRLLRYGSLHGSVLGVEAVKADGTVLDLLRTLRKDNTGYDLKQLFIGSEGTLGVVTAVAVQCVPRPRSVQVAFLEAPSFEAVQAVLARAKAQLGEILSAVEFLDSESMSMVTQHLDGVRNPLAGSSGGSSSSGAGVVQQGEEGGPFYMVVETSGSHEGHDAEKLEAFLEGSMEDGQVTNGTLAESQSQAAEVWHVREGITESLVRRGAVYKYDVSIPTARMYDLVTAMRKRLASFPDVRVVGYGHVGDGNLHLNISAPAYDDALLAEIEPYVYKWTSVRGGSISAEHGLGLMKAECIGYSKPPEAVALMAQIKQLMDPNQILNPYKVMPQAALAAAYGK